MTLIALNLQYFVVAVTNQCYCMSVVHQNQLIMEFYEIIKFLKIPHKQNFFSLVIEAYSNES